MLFKPFRDQRIPLLRVLVLAYLPALMLLFCVGLAGVLTQVRVADLTRDMAVAAGVPLYFGILSNIGIFLWCATASLCLLTALLLHNISDQGDARIFLFYAGALTMLLMFDDAFLFHERIAPLYLGVENEVVLAIQGLLLLAILIRYRNVVAQSDYTLLLLSLGAFASAVAFDKLNDYALLSRFGIDSQALKFMLEDGLKLLGIVGWLSYFARTCHGILLQCLRMTAAPRAHAVAQPPLGQSPAARQPASLKSGLKSGLKAGLKAGLKSGGTSELL